MRELKFRAWQDNQMLTQPISGVYGSKRFFGLLYEDTELMQYTGLKDKNGVGIWEGDIIRIPDDWDGFGAQAGGTNEVYFAHGGFRLKPKYNPRARGYWLEDVELFEVIGNVYENPDLIERKG